MWQIPCQPAETAGGTRCRLFEHHSQPLLPQWRFLGRLLRRLAAGLGVIAVSLLAGMAGYHELERVSWIDPFLNAAMILSGMGPLHSPPSSVGNSLAGGGHPRMNHIYCD